jgi:hypothetical protein
MLTPYGSRQLGDDGHVPGVHSTSSRQFCLRMRLFCWRTVMAVCRVVALVNCSSDCIACVASSSCRYSPVPSSSPPGTPGRNSPSSSSSSNRHLSAYPFAGSGPTTAASGGSATARRERLAELYAKHGLRRGPGGMIVPPPGGRDKQQREDDQRWRCVCDLKCHSQHIISICTLGSVHVALCLTRCRDGVEKRRERDLF